ASCDSDGFDFLDGVAGGIVDYKTFEIIENKKIDINKYLETHNSYDFLKKVNGLISMGNGTGTNVCDIQVCVVWK
ncbi:glycerate kinase, partial [Candidatus Parcubacteria bacterium]|nr:glycerate kinase [Candidatus Parcubacteria bacterium]